MNRLNGKWLRNAVAAGLALTLAFAGPVMPATAQELAPEHLALAREFVDLTDITAIYETTLLQAGIAAASTILRTNPEIRDQTDEAIGKTIETYATDKGQLLDQFARIYALRFSMDELKQIVDFYNTEVGKKLTAQNGAINVDLQRVLAVFKNNLQKEFFARVRANLKDMGIEI